MEELTCPHVVGAKQVRRALTSGKAARLYVAANADPALTAPIVKQAEELGVPVEHGVTMAQLGHACGIAVGASIAATLVLTE